MQEQKFNTEVIKKVIIERHNMPPSIYAIYYPPFLVIANHLSQKDAIKIQEIFKEKTPALKSGFIFAVAVRQSDPKYSALFPNFA